ncbi:MAG: BsuPI-related putative proteinase inhibitor [Gemmatimonadaceae bacterium]
MSSRPVIWLLLAGVIALAGSMHARSTDAVAGDSASARVDAESRVAAAAPARHARREALPPAHVETTVSVNVGRGATFQLHATNTGDRHVELHFATGQTHDFVVLDSIGREVWRWGAGRMFTSSLQTKMLGAHATTVFEESWDARAKHGRFTVVARLESSDFPAEERAEFVLP